MNEKEYNESNLNHTWFKPSFLGSAGLTALGVAAMKMKGPLGPLVTRIRDRLTYNSAVRASSRYFDAGVDVTKVVDMQSAIDTGLPEYGKINAAHVPTQSELIEGSKNLYGELLKTESSVLTDIKYTESEISYTLNKGYTRRGHTDKDLLALTDKLGVASDEAHDVLMARTKLNSLLQHQETQHRDVGGQFFVDNDFRSPAVRNDVLKHKNNIEEAHLYYLENDQQYAKTYQENIKKIDSTLHHYETAKKVSNPTRFQNDPKLLPKKYGSINDAMNVRANVQIKDTSLALYEAHVGSDPMTKLKIDGMIDSNIKTNKMTTRHISNYATEIGQLAEALESFKEQNSISKNISGGVTFTRIRYDGYQVGASTRNYIYVDIGYQKPGVAKPHVITRPIAIAYDNVNPSLTSLRSRVTGSVQWMSANPWEMNNAEMISKTKLDIKGVTTDLKSSFMNKLTDDHDPIAFEKAWLKNAKKKEGIYTPLSGEMRDWIRANQVRFVADYRMHNQPTGSLRQRIHQAKVGLQSLKAMRDMKGQNANILVLDLETANRYIDSPSYAPGSKATSIWGLGLTEYNGATNTMDGLEIASDHVLYEQRFDKYLQNGVWNRDAIRHDLTNHGSQQGHNLRGMAAYMRKSHSVEGIDVESQIDSIIEFHKFIKDRSSHSNRVNKHGAIRSTKQFAEMAVKKVKDYAARQRRDGKPFAMVSANGIDFDLRLLHHITGDSEILNIMKQIDTTSIGRLMTAGHADRPAMSVDALLDFYGKKTGYGSVGSLADDPERFIKLMTQKTQIVGHRDKRAMQDILTGQAGKNFSSHNSPLYDTVKTLWLYKQQMQFHEKDHFFILDDIDKYIHEAEGQKALDQLNAYMSKQGMILPGGRGVMSFGLTSANAASKFIGSNYDIGHIWAFSTLNPGNKDLGQMGRTNHFKKPAGLLETGSSWSKSKFRFRNPLMSANESNIAEWMTRTSEYNANQYANTLQFNTIFTLGGAGHQEGFTQITRDAMSGLNAVKHSYLRLDELDSAEFSSLRSDLYKMQDDVIKEASKIAKVAEVDIRNGNKKGQLAADIWERASTMVMQKRAAMRGDQQIRIDPNDKIQMWTMMGDKRIKFSSNVAGTVRGIRLDIRPGQEGPARWIADVMYESSGDSLSNTLVNIGHSKSGINVIDVNAASAAVAYGKFGLMGTPELQTNFDWISKKYYGSLKEGMLRKAINMNINIAHGTDNQQRRYTPKERKQAKKNLTKITNMLKEKFGEATNKNGMITYGKIGTWLSNDEITRRAASIGIDDIMGHLSAVGHEAVWQEHTMKMWYNYFGDNIAESRGKIKTYIKNLKEGVDSSTKSWSKATGQVLSSTDQHLLFKYLDPLSFIEEMDEFKYAKRNGTVKSIEEFYERQIRSGKMNDFLKEKNIPIAFQVLGDLYDHNTLRIGMAGYFQKVGMYGINEGHDPKYNHKVKFRRNYFDNVMQKNGILSDHTKRLLLRSANHNHKSKYQDLVTQFNKLDNALNNSTLSTLMRDHKLDVEDIQRLLNKDLTTQNKIKMLEYLKTNSEKGLVIQQALDAGELYHADLSADQQAELLKFRGMQDDIRTLSELDDFSKIKTYHVSDVNNTWGRIAKKKQNIWFLPANEIGSDKVKVNLTEIIANLNESNKHSRDPIKADVFINVLKNIENKHNEAKTAKAERLFNFVKNDNGDHVIEMAGWVLPSSSETQNIMNKLDDIDGFGPLQHQAAATRDMLDAFNAQYKLTIEGKSKFDHVHGVETLNNHWVKMMTYNMGMSKDSAAFAAHLGIDLPGTNIRYMVNDNIQSKAVQLMDALKNGRQIGALDKVNAKNRGKLSKVLENIINMKANTLLGTSRLLFDKRQMGVLSDGSAVNMAEHIKKGESKFIDWMSSVKRGENYMPGGIFTRFPTEQSGVHAIFETDFLAVPDYAAKVLGMDNEHIYYNQTVGALIKADTDGDQTPFMMKAYNTLEEMKERKKDSERSLQKLMQLPDTQRPIADFNNMNVEAMTYTKNGKNMSKIMQINPSNGSIYYKDIPTKELVWVADPKDVEKMNLFEGFLNPLAAKEVLAQSNAHKSQKVIERNIQTVVTNVYSKSTIGLWTNTMRTRIHEVMGANANLVKNSRALMDMIGTLKTGMTGISQDSVALGKHGSLEHAKDMALAHDFWKNPGLAKPESRRIARESFLKQYSDDALPRAIDTWNLLFSNMEATDYVKKWDKNYANFKHSEASILYGTKGSNFMDMIQYNQYKEESMAEVDTKLSAMFSESLNAILGPAQQKYAGRFDTKEYTKSFTDILGEHFFYDKRNLSNELFNEKVGAKINKLKLGGKKFGKAAGIGTIAFLAFNFFNPMNNYNDNNRAFSDVQLPSNVPIDLVSPSFANEAFIKMNNNKSSYKESQSSMIKKQLDDLLGNDTRHMKLVNPRKSRGKVSYTNMTSNIGVLGNANIQRQSRMF